MGNKGKNYAHPSPEHLRAMKAAIELKGVQQHKLASHLGVSRQVMNHWLTGINGMPFRKMYMIHQYFDFDPSLDFIESYIPGQLLADLKKECPNSNILSGSPGIEALTVANKTSSQDCLLERAFAQVRAAYRTRDLETQSRIVMDLFCVADFYEKH